MGRIHEGGGSEDRIAAIILYIFSSLHDITVSDILGHGTSIVSKLKYKVRDTKRSKHYKTPTSLARNVLT